MPLLCLWQSCDELLILLYWVYISIPEAYSNSPAHSSTSQKGKSAGSTAWGTGRIVCRWYMSMVYVLCRNVSWAIREPRHLPPYYQNREGVGWQCSICLSFHFGSRIFTVCVLATNVSIFIIYKIELWPSQWRHSTTLDFTPQSQMVYRKLLFSCFRHLQCCLQKWLRSSIWNHQLDSVYIKMT